MKRFALALIVLIVPLSIFGQDKLPPEAKKVVDKYEKTVSDAKKVYDAAVTKACEQALKELKPIQVSETKKGNLDNALSVKAKIEEISLSIPIVTDEKIKSSDLSKPTPPFADANSRNIIGKWKVTAVASTYSGIWEFKENGIVERQETKGSYEIVKDKVVIRWEKYSILDYVNLPKNNLAVTDGYGGTDTPQNRTELKRVP